MEPATIGLDLAKHVFHVHVSNSAGNTLQSKKLSRKDVLPFFGVLSPCLVGIEACASGHY